MDTLAVSVLPIGELRQVYAEGGETGGQPDGRRDDRPMLHAFRQRNVVQIKLTYVGL